MITSMTPDDLIKLRALAQAAQTDRVTVWSQLPDGTETTDYELAKRAWPALTKIPYRVHSPRVEYAEAAQNALPALIDECERSRALLSEFDEVCKDRQEQIVELFKARAALKRAEEERDEAVAKVLQLEIANRSLVPDAMLVVTDVECLRVELDTARAEVERLKAEVKQVESERDYYIRADKAWRDNIERDTAEAIAAWVDARYGQGFDKPTRIASDIRAHAWRKEQGK